MSRKLLFNCFLLLFSFSLHVNAADKIPSWKPPVEEYDWVQLTSGEWLKGEIKAFYNRVLEFNSSKLKLLNIKWEDIKYLESHIDSIVRIEDHGVITGKLQLTGDKVTITRGESTAKFDRSRLISFITGEVKESNYWSGLISFGLNIRSGNTDQTDYLAKASIKRRTSQTRLILDYSGSISSIDSVETTNNHRLNFAFDYFKTRYFFTNPYLANIFVTFSRTWITEFPWVRVLATPLLTPQKPNGISLVAPPIYRHATPRFNLVNVRQNQTLLSHFLQTMTPDTATPWALLPNTLFNWPIKILVV